MEKRTKILYVITKSNLGGASRYVLELATLLPKESYDVQVAVGGAGILKDKLGEAGIPTHSIAHFQRDINIFKEVSSLIELWRIVRTVNPDIIHLNSSKAGGLGAVVARLLGVPNIIFTAHGWPFFEKRNIVWKSLAWLFSWITALLAHKVILVSHHDHARTHMPYVQHKLTVIHTAVPQIEFLSRDDAREALRALGAHIPPDGTHWVCTIGEYVKNKNLLQAIRAVEAVHTNGTQKLSYALIGIDGDERPHLETYIREHKLENSVQLLGFIDNARIYLKAFDIFLLPSLKEGLPYGLLEAGAAGLPCIASNVGGIPEVITHNETGLLIDPNDTESIRRALEQMIQYTPRDIPLSYTLGQALKEKVTRDFSLETMITETSKLYTNTENN